MPSAECPLSGSGPQAILIDTYLVSQNAAANTSTFRIRLWYLGKGYGSWSNSTQYWSLSGQYNASGSFTIPQGSNDIFLHDGYMTLTHDGNGNLGAWGVTGCIDTNHSSIGDGCCGVTEPAPPRIGRVPGATGTPSASSITPTSAVVSFSAATRGHCDIDYTRLHWADNPGFSPLAGFTDQNNTSRTITGLNPGTTYYLITNAHNCDGFGPSSVVGSFTTLPSTPAVLTSVTPGATGVSATVVMAPPSGIGSVSSYTIEARTPGGSWTVMASGSANPSQVVSGLVPGQTYEWRVAAVIGTYTSPYSTPTITVAQPQPNASPGSYWDGNTPDTPSTNYTFTGTPGTSTSEAQTLTGGAVGWLSGAEAVDVSGGTAVQYQVAGSIEPNGTGGDWSVRYIMLTGATVNGFRAGTDGDDGYAEVTVGGRYMGSIWVEPSRARTLAAMWVWYDAVGEIGTSIGSAVVVPTDPTRLTVLGTAPVGAIRGAVVVTDPAGAEMMEAGDTLTVDADMASTGTLYPYFDGDTLDTAQFIYDWEDAPQTSPSFREDIPQDEQNPLADPDCPPIPTPPRPPVIPDDCIVPVGSWRRTWYLVDASDVPAFLSAVPTVNLETFGYPENQVRIRWYANPDNTPPLDFDSSSWQFEQIVSYIPPCTLLTLDGVSRRAWATVGLRQGAGTGGDPYVCVPGDYPTIPADSLVRGTNNVPPTWPVLSCGFGWLISLDTPLDAPVGNLVVDASLTVRE